jgi:hypothetical protein
MLLYKLFTLVSNTPLTLSRNSASVKGIDEVNILSADRVASFGILIPTGMKLLNSGKEHDVLYWVKQSLTKVDTLPSAASRAKFDLILEDF